MQGFDWFVLEGSEDWLRGFVAGWAHGAGLQPQELDLRIIWAKDRSIHTQSLVESLFGSLRLGASNHVLVRRDTADALSKALEPHVESIRLRSRIPVQGARFDFSFEIFSREEAIEVRRIFDNLPQGVRLSSDYEPEEETRSEDRPGPEMYAPVHDYVFRARGTAAGTVEGVLQLYLRTRQHERIHAKHVELETASRAS